MLPFRDDDSARRTVPLVTYALIVLKVLFFFVELSGGDVFFCEVGICAQPLPCQPRALIF